jgi:hypothetical protein
MKYKIFVVGPAKHYSDWIYNHELTDVLEEADIVLFTGGEDVDPSLYGCEPHPNTYSNLIVIEKKKKFSILCDLISFAWEFVVDRNSYV